MLDCSVRLPEEKTVGRSKQHQLTARPEIPNHRCEGGTVVCDVLDDVEANDRIDGLRYWLVAELLDTAAEDIYVVEIGRTVLESVSECGVRFYRRDPDAACSQLQRDCANAGPKLEYVASSMRKRASPEPLV